MKTAPAFPIGARGLLLALALVALIAPAALAADGYLGVRIQDVDETLAAALDLDDDAGVLVSEVMDDSPAEAAGLQRGDLILTINGREASDSEYFTRRVRRIDAGDTATIELVRKGKPMTISVTLGEAPENEFFGTAPRHIKVHGGDAVWLDDEGHDFTVRAPHARVDRLGGAHLGVNVHSLDKDLGRYFGADEGVLVLGVNEDTAAEEAGLQTGDVILSVDGEAVDSTIGLHEVLADFDPGDEVEVAYLRDKQQKTVTVELGESADMLFVRDFSGPEGPRGFHLQRAPHHPGAVREYLIQPHDPDDIHEELQRMREQLDRLEKELEAAEEGE